MSEVRCAIYARVSTLLQQDPEHQLVHLRDLANNRGFVVSKEYVDFASGTKERRPALDGLRKDAKIGKFEIVIIYALDRLGRNTRHLLNLLHELDGYGVTLISQRESLDLTSNIGKAVFGVLSVIATLEVELCRERIRNALAAKKIIAQRTQNGWRCGRPKILDDALKCEILRLRSEGMSIRQIERHLNKRVSHTVIGRVVKGVNKTSETPSSEEG